MQTLILTTFNSQQTDIFLRLAEQLHVEAKLVEGQSIEEKKITAQLSESTFSKEWGSEEDEHWDDFLK
jgi:hypothetical protein